MAAKIPRDGALDNTIAVFKEGYEFIPNRCRRFDSDLFEARILGRIAVCMSGEEAARVFAEPGRFTRKGAAPPTTLMLLQDKGSVQQLDGEAHRRRKQMFMSLVSDDDATGSLVRHAQDQWRLRIDQWSLGGAFILHEEVQELMCRAVCDWAGVPLPDSDAPARTREFAAMIDGAGSFGPRNWRGLLLRRRTERWVRQLVRGVRMEHIMAPPDSALYKIATRRRADGEYLHSRVATVEMLNILRPTVAVAWFITFAALALHERPMEREKVANDDRYLEWFVQEVRRFYPFFPFVGGRVREEFEWRDRRFASGDWVLLDLYGTNHDSRAWDRPYVFRPERFADWDGSAFDFIPQGPGDHHREHRCPGESFTIALMKDAVRQLTTAMKYDVPQQDLGFSLSRMPAVPRSGFVIDNVRRPDE